LRSWITGTLRVANPWYEKESAAQSRKKVAGLCCPRGTRIQSGGAQGARRKSQARIVASRLAEREPRGSLKGTKAMDVFMFERKREREESRELPSKNSNK